MEVKIHNDGKGKYRSVECYLDLDNLNISGCGYDKEEAFISMIESLKSTINYLNKLSEEQVELIKNHLNLVFYHEIDPSYSNKPDVQEAMNKIHNFNNSHDGIKMRC